MHTLKKDGEGLGGRGRGGLERTPEKKEAGNKGVGWVGVKGEEEGEGGRGSYNTLHVIKADEINMGKHIYPKAADLLGIFKKNSPRVVFC